MEALRAGGFRDALPGEFTVRAFMNGKLDLTRSESVMELVCATTDKGRGYAIQRLSGLLETEINRIKKLLTVVLAGAELYLDYSEDEVSVDTDEKAGILPGQEQARTALEQLRALGETWNRQRIYQEGITAVIAGRPNAGKSSLFNYLLKEDRSIVTEIPGTTRDWIEASVSIEGIPVRLADTAGIRESTDTVEALGVQRTRELLDSAELILYLIDGAEGITAEDRMFLGEYDSAPLQNEKTGAARRRPMLLLWNKADINPLPANTAECYIIEISAKTGKGVAELSRALAESVLSYAEDPDETGSHAQEAALGSSRQKNLVDAAIAALEEALSLACRGEPLDLIAPLLRDAINALGEITGEVSTADILEEMFSRFCVGK
jgi:tRNA modification GTPase